MKTRIMILITCIGSFVLGCSLTSDRGHGHDHDHDHNPASALKRLISSNHPSSHIFSASATKLLAESDEQDESGIVHAQAITPLAQSFDAVCNQTLDPTFIPAGAFMPVPISRAGVSDCNFFSTVIQGGGKKIHDAANLSTLVVDLTLDDNSIVTCEDRTHTPAVADGDLVQAYFVLDTGQALVADGVTPTTLTCTVAIPPGRVVKQIEAQWQKG